MTEVLHLPDFDGPKDEYGDVTHAVCGKEVRLGDMTNWFGMLMQINCTECLTTLGEKK